MDLATMVQVPADPLQWAGLPVPLTGQVTTAPVLLIDLATMVPVPVDPLQWAGLPVLQVGHPA